MQIFNTNTSRIIVDTIRVDDDGDYAIPDVKGTGSEVKVAFVDPAGSMTGALFPTDRRCDTVHIKETDGHRFSVRATRIDATNPFILVDETSLPPYLKTRSQDPAGYLKHIESIRRTGAVMMGLASSKDAVVKVRGTPKLVIVSSLPQDKLSECLSDRDIPNIHVQAFSMGKLHPSLQLTGAACLASAVCIEGTVSHRVASSENSKSIWHLPSPERTPSPSSESDESVSGLLLDRRTICISYASGSIKVKWLATSADTFAVVDRCIVSRTALRLFEGKVYFYEDSM